MKKIFFATALVIASFTSFQAKASLWDIIEIIADAKKHDRHETHRPAPFYGGVTCSYQDKGWEEHWRGHGSCGECLAEHGKCVEVCSMEYEVCDITLEDFEGRQTMNRIRVRDRWEAENEARNMCFYNRLRSCVVTSCSTEREVVSSRSCR